MILTVFVPGRLRNPLNGSWGSWQQHARIARDWRDRTSQYIFVESIRFPTAFLRHTKKRVTFTAHVSRLWDHDEGLNAAMKPLRDAVAKIVCPGDDGPKSGNEFRYRQEVTQPLGVRITVEALL